MIVKKRVPVAVAAFRVVAVLLSASLCSYAADFFVAPTAGTNGDGSVSNPWSLETVLQPGAPVNPGDTVWLRAGVYVPSQSNYPAFESYLGGATNAPIMVRPYPGEHVVLREHPQYVGPDDQTILYVYGSNTWFWDLEVASLSTTRVVNVAGPDPSPSQLPLPSGVQVRGANIKLINLIVHDTRGGLGLWQEAVNCEAFGCIIYNNGWKELTGGGHGHGAYCQNSNGVMRLSDNIIFNQFANGVQGYTVNSQVRNLVLERNTVFGNARMANYPQNDTGEQLVFGGNARIENLSILNNRIFQSLSMNGVTIRTDYGGAANSNAVFGGNYVAGGSGGGNFQVTSTDYDSLIFTNNTLYSTNGSLLAVQAAPADAIDHNAYYGNGGQSFSYGSWADFAGWRAATGFDSNSSYFASITPTNQVFVDPNAYESRRANVVVFNWSGADNVAVDVSSVLSSGDVYEVRNAQDYFAPPVLTGMYTGASLSLPMTNLTVAIPNGWTNTAAVPTTGKQFNVFVLIGTATGMAQSFPLNPYVQVLDGQWQGTRVASDGNCYFASSTHDNMHGAAFFRYQPAIGVLTLLTNDITRVCGEDPTVTPPQGKIHSDILEHDGWLYFATHLGNYWPEAEAAYTGAHVVGYELSTGHFRDFGVIRSNYTIYAGIGLDPVRNKLIVYTTQDWLPPPTSYVYRIDIATGTKELLGAVPGIAAFWFFVDNRGDCWISPQGDNGSLLRVNSATGFIDRWPNVLPSNDVSGDRFWAWAEPLPDGDRCVFRLQEGNDLYIFDANAFEDDPSNGFSIVQNIGPYGLGMALGQDRVFYVQRDNRQEGQQGYQDFHLLSVSLETNGTPAIADHGLITDQSGRLAWRIAGMAADSSNRVYMVGDWWLLPGEQGSPTGTLRHVDGPGTNYTAEVRGEFFAVAALSIPPPPPPPPPSSSNYPQTVSNNNPVAYWRLNERSGATIAADLMGVHNGTIGANATPGIGGPQSPLFPGFETNNTAMQLNSSLANSYLTMPALNLNTNTVTITGWINPASAQVGWAGIAFCRGGSTVAGLHFGPGTILNELRYTWNNDGTTFNRSTGLSVPTNQWSFVALSVTPTNATIYLGTNGTLNMSTQTISLPNQAFDSSLYLGYDPSSGGRPFNGKVDEIAVYNHSLTPAQIQQLYTSALTAPPTPFQTWQLLYFGCTNCPQAAANADPDGDGQNNSTEFAAGTNPTDGNSTFRIISAAREGNDIEVAWQTAGGRTNALQATAGDANGGYLTNFSDVSGPIIVYGSGDTTTSYVDSGAVTNFSTRYYRVRTVP
ncbi:MAG TPA: LamG-like jellyroll fold domain-containing protein [Verrucomicrobiae bacterium]|nr:LamG-like jellyroll fold domain-containing protein [Verrucomicrobiae bacterium]